MNISHPIFMRLGDVWKLRPYECMWFNTDNQPDYRRDTSAAGMSCDSVNRLANRLARESLEQSQRARQPQKK